MIQTDIHIAGGSKVNTYTQYGLIYVSADNRYDAPYKEIDKTTYPEEAGVHVIPVAVKDEFDYKVTFLIEGTTLTSINSRISTFNAALISSATPPAFKKVTFYNYSRKVKIVGYPQPIPEAKDFWYTSLGSKTQSAMVEFTIHVVNPSECNFNDTSSTPV